MSGAISLVVTVSRTKGVGVVMSGDSCICVCGVEDCYCEGCMEILTCSAVLAG